MTVVSLIRPEFLSLQGYQAIKRKKNTVNMNKNENPWQTIGVYKKLQLNRYPDFQNQGLIDRIREFYCIGRQDILLTRGSDEGIDLIIRLFCRPYKDTILVMDPTFAMYEIYANINAVQVQRISLGSDNFSLDLSSFPRDNNFKVIFICSPNNPTGNIIEIETIQALCRRYSKSIIVVDEAYIDFSSGVSCLSLLDIFSNLIVLRTLSKSFGLAGIRCGMIFASKEIVNYLKKITAPYTLSSLTTYTAIQCFTPSILSKIQRSIKRIKSERANLYQSLVQLDQLFSKVWPSEANFILVKSKCAQQLQQYCVANDIYLRAFSQDSDLKNCLRISVGTSLENQRLLSVLQSYLEEGM